MIFAIIIGGIVGIVLGIEWLVRKVLYPLADRKAEHEATDAIAYKNRIRPPQQDRKKKWR